MPGCIGRTPGEQFAALSSVVGVRYSLIIKLEFTASALPWVRDVGTDAENKFVSAFATIMTE